MGCYGGVQNCDAIPKDESSSLNGTTKKHRSRILLILHCAVLQSFHGTVLIGIKDVVPELMFDFTVPPTIEFSIVALALVPQVGEFADLYAARRNSSLRDVRNFSEDVEL